MAAPPMITFDRSKVMGTGRNSTVYCGLFKNSTIVAVKRIQIENIPNDNRFHSLKSRRDTYVSRETTLKELNHPNVVKLMGTEIDSTSIDFKLFALERCKASLEQFCTGRVHMNPNIRLSPSQKAYMQFLQSQIEVITMPSNAKVFLDITRGLRYIHSKGFAHRNIKPSNILISEGLPVTLVISDFGLSKPISRDTGSCSISHSNSGNGDTACWTAPEMLDDPNDEAYGDKRDFPQEQECFREIVESMIKNEPANENYGRMELEDIENKLKCMLEIYDERDDEFQQDINEEDPPHLDYMQ